MINDNNPAIPQMKADKQKEILEEKAEEDMDEVDMLFIQNKKQYE